MVATLASASNASPSSSGGAQIYDGTTDTIHLDSAALMFRGTYAHAGPDLAITGPGGEKALIVGYFASEHPATLVSPEGAILSGETVTQLAGARFAGAVAEVGPGTAKAPIGQVETSSGAVTITHADGTKAAGAPGTPVFEGDIVETDGSGRVSITFADKTVASLGESARIVLDKFVYDPSGSGNSMLLNLVHGAFVFVAGLVAPTGDMKIETPVATMGIRGTTGIVRADIQDGTSYFTLKPDPAGKLGGPGGHVGAFDVFARLDGALIKEVRVPDQLLIVRNASGQFEDLTTIDPKEAALEQRILEFAFAAHQQMLERIEGGQQPLSPDVKPKQPVPGQNNGNTTPNDHPNDAGLNTTPNNFDTLRNPIDVDLLKQTDPLGNETTGTGTTQGGTTSTGTSQDGRTLAPPVEFTNSPITVGFFQQTADQGIQGTFPISFTGGATTPVITSTVATVSTIAFAVGGDAPHPFSLTPEQIAAIANAYNPATGTLSLNLDTTFLGAGQQVILTVNVTISDGLTSATQSLVFAFVGLNDAPVLNSTFFALTDTPNSASAGFPSGQLVATDPDQDATLTFKITGQTPDSDGVTRVVTAYGTLTVTSDGHYAFVPNAAGIDTVGAGETRHVEIAVEVTDGRSAPSKSTIAFDITGANDAPVLASTTLAITDTAAADTIAPISGQLPGSDPDSNATLTYTIVGQSPGEGGSTSIETAYGILTLDASGHYTFTPDNAAVNALTAGQTQQLKIDVALSDGIAPPATSTITINITGVDDAPQLAAVSRTITDTAATDTFAPLTGQLAGSDAETPAAGLTYSIVGGGFDEGGGMFKVTPYGTLFLSSSGDYVFDPNSDALNALVAGETHQLKFDVSLSDGTSAPTVSTITIDLIGANDAPVFATDGLTGARTLGGSATASNATYTLTPNNVSAVGAVWQQVDLSHDAQWNVRAYFGNGPAGSIGTLDTADGIVFAFQNTGATAVGSGGEYIGIAGGGVPDAVGFRIDTYPLNSGTADSGGSHFIQFFNHATFATASYAQQLTAYLNDGNTHDLTINWDAAAKTLTYTLDGTYTATLTRDIVALDFGGDGSVFGGFTAGSGAAKSMTSVAFDDMANGATGLVVERQGAADSTEMRTISGSLYFSDAETGDTHKITVTGPDDGGYGGLTTRLVSDANGEGRIEWTYSVRDGALDNLADGETVTEVYHVAVNDGAATTTTDVKITLVGRAEPYGGGDGPIPTSEFSASDDVASQVIIGSIERDVISLAMQPGTTIRAHIDGGPGNDALILTGSNGMVDLTALASGQIKNIENINIAQGTAQTLKLSLDTVIDMTSSANTDLANAVAYYNTTHPEIKISGTHALLIEADRGPSGDTLEIVAATANSASGTWSLAGTVNIDTVSAGDSPHDVYNFTTTAGEVLATIAVHHDVEVAQHAAAA